jgi:O-antigen ligase
MIVAAALAYYVAFAPSHLLGGSSSGRSDEWRIAWRMFLNHPLNGVGLGNFVVLEPGYATQNFNISFVGEVVKQALVAHNTYLELAAELGLAGVVLVLAVIGLVLRTGFQALKQLSGSGDLLEFYARGLVAGAIGMFAAYVFLSAEYEKQLWLVLGLVVALSALAGNAGSRDVSRAP